jgi:transcription initiation factor TFIIIB Brf1 subunit/transcription initiation factor TFIIB
MGRITKEKIDQIGKLRKEGYCQKEIAQKVGVSVRTVRKYDPTRKSKSESPYPTEQRLRAIWEVIPLILDWLDVLIPLLLYEEKHACPRCRSDETEFHLEESIFYCSDCDLSLFFPREICRQCLSPYNVYYDERDRAWMCAECGARQVDS